jgi:Zn-dependent protease
MSSYDEQKAAYVERKRQEYLEKQRTQIPSHNRYIANASEHQHSSGGARLGETATPSTRLWTGESSYDPERPSVLQRVRDACPTCAITCAMIQQRVCGVCNKCGCSCIRDGPAKGSIRICTLPILGGVPIHIHYWWPVFLIFACISALYTSARYFAFVLLLGGPLLYGTVLVHELGHCAMAKRCGGEIDLVLLWPLGGLAYVSYFGESNPCADFWVAIGGPLTHIPQAAIWAGLMAALTAGQVRLMWPMGPSAYDFLIALCAGGLALQLSLFLFNLIPAFPLDGGRILAAGLAWKKIDQVLSLKICAMVGGVSGCIVIP